MRIGLMILVIFFVVALLGSIGGTSYFYLKSVDSLEQRVYEHLESTSQSRAHHIETFLEQQKEMIEIAATHQELTFEELKEITKINEGFHELSVLDSNGIIISSSDESNLGLDKSGEEYFIEGIKKTHLRETPLSEITKKRYIEISTPHNSGVLVAKIDFTIFDVIVLDKTGLGNTGETYLINKESYSITPLLFIEDPFLELKIDTINSRNCLYMLDNPQEIAGEHVGHEAVNIFLDYRGERVVGSHHPIKNISWCLLAEMDDEEILYTQKELFRNISLRIIIIITLIVTLIGHFLGRYLDKIFALKKGKKRL